MIPVLLLIALQDTPPPATASAPAEPARIIDQRADDALRELGRVLREAKAFRVEMDVVFDLLDVEEQKLQFSRHVSVELKRPDRLRGASIGDDWDKEYVYDGKQVAILDKRANCYSTIETPASVDAMLDFLDERYGMSLPTADLFYSDPYVVLTEFVEAGRYLGKHRVGEELCHHLAFRTPAVDWQIWLADGDKPLPRKLVVTYKDRPQSPQFCAVFRNWDLSPTVKDERFTFQPPHGWAQIPVQPRDTNTEEESMSDTAHDGDQP